MHVITKSCILLLWMHTLTFVKSQEIKCELSLPAFRGTIYEPAYKIRFSTGEKLRVICGDTYWILDSHTRLAETACQENGEWTIGPVCQEVTCSRPRDRYFSYWEDRFGQQKRLGDTVRYRCSAGYRSTDGATQATCTRDGWQPDPLCRELKCARRIYNNAEIISRDQSEYRERDRVTYRCKGAREKRFTLICGENDWIGDNPCTGCQIESSKHRFEVWPPGNKIYYTCEDGYKPLTKGWWAEATCEDGVWSGLEDCIEECGEPPVIPNGEGILQSFEGQSQKSIITCNKGYTAVIEDLTCHEGRWDLAGRSLDAICRPNADNCSPPLKVENAVVTTPFQKEYPSGSNVTYQCFDKYTVEGEATITCTAGEWEELNIKCRYLFCGSPPSLEDGDIKNTTKERYNPHETIEYMCQSYYTMEGEPYRTCYHGNWTGNMRCLGPCIANEDEMRQHNIIFKSSDYNKYLVHDEIVEFKCARGVPVGTVSMRQRCNSGVIVLPTCREGLS